MKDGARFYGCRDEAISIRVGKTSIHALVGRAENGTSLMPLPFLSLAGHFFIPIAHPTTFVLCTV